jgi:transcriptional regulator with XRE-family HTH domain
MNADPLLRLLPAFGDVLVRCRTKRIWTLDALASASGLSRTQIRGMEAGDYGPSLLEFFRIAEALDEQPVMLLVAVVSAWRADPTDTLHGSRPSDFLRLFRLGYHHKPGDFRELAMAYYSVAESTHAAVKLNAQRLARGVALLDTVCVYVRAHSVSLRTGEGQWAGGQP